MKLDRRQFIIAKESYCADEFLSVNLYDDWILSYHKDLKVIKNGEIFLLGHAYSVDSKLIKLDEKSISNRRNWAGRWILICKDKIYPDVCATMSLCYGYDKKKNICISSSLHLLNNILKHDRINNYNIKYADGNGRLDYYPIPCTPIDGIYKLLPSQYIDLSLEDNHICPQQDWLSRKYSNKSREWIINQVIEKFANEFSNIADEYGNEIWITLTGGVDSRTILALAKHSNIKFHVYTALRNNIKSWDQDLPVQICKRAQIDHIYIDDRFGDDNERAELFDKHCSSCAVGTERQQYIANSDVKIQNKAIVLWGTVWDAYFKSYVCCFNDMRDSNSRFDEINAKCEGILSKSNVHASSIKQWLDYIENNPNSELDWRERFYIEQRIAAWVGGAAQAIDLFDSIRLAPVNCQDILELLLSLDVAPHDKTAQKDIISICCPEIKNIRYGERDDLIYRGIRKIKKYLKIKI